MNNIYSLKLNYVHLTIDGVLKDESIKNYREVKSTINDSLNELSTDKEETTKILKVAKLISAYLKNGTEIFEASKEIINENDNIEGELKIVEEAFKESFKQNNLKYVLGLPIKDLILSLKNSFSNNYIIDFIISEFNKYYMELFKTNNVENFIKNFFPAKLQKGYQLLKRYLSIYGPVQIDDERLRKILEADKKEWEKWGGEKRKHYYKNLIRRLRSAGMKISIPSYSNAVGNITLDLFATIYNMIYGLGTAIITGDKKEDHATKQYKILKVEADNKTTGITISTETKLDLKKDIKTDIKIMTNKKVGISMKGYDFNLTQEDVLPTYNPSNISLELMNIFKVLNSINGDTLTAYAYYANFLVNHELDSSETANYSSYKELKQQSLKDLGIFSLIRSFSGTGGNSFILTQEKIDNENIGPSGYFIAIDTTSSNVYVVNLKTLLYKISKSKNFTIGDYIDDSGSLNSEEWDSGTLILYDKNKRLGNLLDRSINILNEILDIYKKTTYHMIIKKDMIKKNALKT